MSARAREAEVPVVLAREDLETLVAVAHFYEKSMGPMRHIVGLTTAPSMRKRLRFIRDESDLLETLARSELEGAAADQAGVSASLTVPAAVAFWGRLLASLNSKRARRKMSDSEAVHRQELAGKLRDALRTVSDKQRSVVEREVATRRVPEQAWMREALGYL